MNKLIFTLLALFLVYPTPDLIGQSSKKLKLKSNLQTIHARPVTEVPPVLKESSGIAVSSPNRIWSHNDANNTNQLFCFDTTGVLVRTLNIINATNVDWEDLTRDDEGRIYINDAGNNENNRKDLKIYRIPNPDDIAGNIVQADVISFILDDQYQFPPPSTNRNYDIEAILWKSDSLYLFTKNRSDPQNGTCKMYRLPAIPGTYIAQLAGSVNLGQNNDEARVTSADINLGTGEVILLTSTKIVSFTDYPGNSFFDGDMKEFYFSSAVGQVEGIQFVDNSRLFMTEEKSKRSNGHLYEILWQSSSSAENLELKGVSIYPNPFTNDLIIQKEIEEDLQLDIWDIQGRVIQHSEKADSVIHLQHLPSGIYFIRLSGKVQSITTRVVKQ